MRSLRAREFAAISLAVVAAVGVTLVIAVVLVRRSVQHEALRSLARQAALIATQDRGSASSTPPSTLGLFFTTQEERLAILSIPQAVLLLPPTAAAKLDVGDPAQGSISISRHGYLFAAALAGNRAIVLLRPTSLDATALVPFGLAFGIAAAVGVVLAALAAFVLARAVARPIERVSEASLALARGERPGPLPVGGSAEVAALAASFNTMTADLDRARAAERSFLLSVGHELKTPLASIRGHGEALLDGVVAVPRGAGVVIQESKRLERLVRDLLDLARLNQRSFTVDPEPVDLAALAAEAVSRHESEAVRVGVSLSVEGDGPAPALADPDRTIQVLSNLIENALRSTASGGSVTVGVAPARFQVSDTGPGLDAEDLPHAFERFFLYRRYSANRTVGTGLGLAIVKELTEAMGGQVTVASQPGQGTSFTVQLRTAPVGVPVASDALVGAER